MTTMAPRGPCTPDAPLRVAVLASGQGTNLQALIDFTKQEQRSFEIKAVMTNKEHAPALERAARHQIPTHCVPHNTFSTREAFESEMIAQLEQHAIELIVLAGFMRVLTPTFVDHFSNRIVNVHPALCPSFPGIHAPAQALHHGCRITGCTVHLVDAGVDTGPILAQAAVPIVPGDDEASLSKRIQAREHALLPEVIEQIAKGSIRFEGSAVVHDIPDSLTGLLSE